MKTARKVIEQAISWLGRNEADGTHKPILDIYNSHSPLARGYKIKYTDDWCMAFVSAISIKLGYTDIIPTEVGVDKHIQLMKRIGSYIEDENRVPNPGDIIYFDWNDNGIGDNVGFADHVGIVEKVEGRNIITIEGNYSNRVRRRTISVNARYIRGYGVPKYDAEPKYSVEPIKATKPIEAINSIKAVQSYLNAKIGAGLDIDGSYGPLTKKALIKYWQKVVGGLDTDGSFGPKSRAKAYLNNLDKGDRGELVKIMQMALIGKKYSLNPYGADGSFGPATENVVKQFQKDNNLGQDGIVGTKTWTSLLR